MTIMCRNDEVSKEGCYRGHGLSAAINLGSLEKTVIASLFHSGLQKAQLFVEKTMSYVILGNNRLCRFWQKKTKKNMMPN